MLRAIDSPLDESLANTVSIFCNGFFVFFLPVFFTVFLVNFLYCGSSSGSVVKMMCYHLGHIFAETYASHW